jgi:hypothetical protein
VNRRSTVVALAAIAAIAISVPAVAEQANPGVKEVAQVSGAKKLEDDARKIALKALRRANKALDRTKGLKEGAQGPPGATGPAGPTGAAGPGILASSFAQATGAVSTDSEVDYVALPAGPTSQPNVTITVGASGTIQVAAQAFIDEEAGAVSLFEDGTIMPGQSDVCEQALFGDPGPPLFTSPDGFPGGGTWSTPASDPLLGNCASTGPAAPVMFQTTPGTHTYELRYAYCGCTPGDSAEFSQRKLWVTALGS